MGGNYVWGDFCSISDRRLVFSVKCRSRSASDSDQEQTPTSSALGLVVLFFFIFHGWPGFSAGHFLGCVWTGSPSIPRKPISPHFKRRAVSLCSCWWPMTDSLKLHTGIQELINREIQPHTLAVSRHQTLDNCCYCRQLAVRKSN